MYLDNIVTLSRNREMAEHQFNQARSLFNEFGQPESLDKAQRPATSVKWLCIKIDTLNMTLSVPEEKLKEIVSQVSCYVRARSMTKKLLQSILGQLLHIAKCVPQQECGAPPGCLMRCQE